MKRLLYIIIIAAVATTGKAQTIGEAFYIYRNDGQVNVFVRDEIESMEYSYEDSEGNHYDEIVTQIVNTADSIYKIPLAVIDSIGFVTPETKYQPGVVVIEGELRQYVESVDEMQIIFSSQIQNTLLPSVGDKLVTLEQSDMFPYGFLGEVASVVTTSEGSHIVSCEAANMTDVFKCYYGVADYSVDTSGSRLRRAQHQGEGVFTPGPFQFGLTDEWTRIIHLDDRFAFSYNPNFTVNVSPTLRIRGYIIVPDHEDHELHISLSCYGDFHLTEHVDATGTLRWNRDFGWTDPETHLPRLSRPIPQCPLIRFYIEPGVFVRAAAKISSQLELNQDYRLVFHYDVSATTGQSLKPRFEWIPVDASASGVITMNGSVAVGGYAEMGFLIQDKRFAHLCFRGEIGVEGESNAVLMQDDVETAARSTAVYEQLHNTAFNINWFRGSKLEGRIWPFSVSHNLPLSSRGNIASLGHVPDFSNVSLTADGEGALKAEAEVRGNIMRPVRVGFTLQDENENAIETYFAQTEYQITPSLLSHTFSGLEAGKKYTVYPVVELLDIYMLASPSATSEAKGFPVTLSDFKVTNKQHKEDGFTHNGQSYDYCFNVSITATLDDDAENIAEWGYVYLDPNGQEAFIPLSGHSYTDTRYAYYRNGTPPFTCTLYGYVKYVGSNEVVRGEPHSYSLEYNNRIQIETGYANPFSDYAQLKGHIDNNTDVVFDRCGFLYNTTGDPKVGNAIMQTCDINSDGTFEAIITNLDEKKVYYYIAFVVVDGNIYYGQTKTLFTIDIECFIKRGDCCVAWAGDCYAMASHLGYNKNFLSQIYEIWGWVEGLELSICVNASYDGLKAYEAYLQYLPKEKQIYNWAESFYPGLAGDPEDEYNQCVHSASDD